MIEFYSSLTYGYQVRTHKEDLSGRKIKREFFRFKLLRMTFLKAVDKSSINATKW
jgi:hypothetical protein